MWPASFPPLLRLGDLKPIFGFCFPLFPRVLPGRISIRVETCGNSTMLNECGCHDYTRLKIPRHIYRLAIELGLLQARYVDKHALFFFHRRAKTDAWSTMSRAGSCSCDYRSDWKRYRLSVRGPALMENTLRECRFPKRTAKPLMRRKP